MRIGIFGEIPDPYDIRADRESLRNYERMRDEFRKDFGHPIDPPSHVSKPDVELRPKPVIPKSMLYNWSYLPEYQQETDPAPTESTDSLSSTVKIFPNKAEDQNIPLFLTFPDELIDEPRQQD